MEDEWHRCGDKHKTKKSNPRTVLFIIQRASISRFILDIVSGIISLCSGRNSMSRRILFVLFIEPTACVCACACVRCIRHAIHQKKMTRNKTVCMLFYLFSESVHPIKMISTDNKNKISNNMRWWWQSKMPRIITQYSAFVFLCKARMLHCMRPNHIGHSLSLSVSISFCQCRNNIAIWRDR